MMEMNEKHNSAEPKVISRFTLAILGCLAIGIGIGSQLPFNFGGMAILGGVVALGFYQYQTRRILRKHAEQNETCRIIAEERLTQAISAPEQIRERTPQAV